ncbi:MAG: NUDIX hydrolase [Clostridia bacterium]|nr:NUDIX hydrolase [Clostridia bacterium]
MDRNKIDFSDISTVEEKLVKRQVIFEGKVLRLEKDDITLPDGRPAIREVIRHHGAVAVVPIDGNGRVICVRQFRYPYREILLEIPAGKLEPGEDDHEAAARRELREETGAIPGKMTYLGKFYSSAAILDEIIHVYLAEDLSWGDTDPDDDEFLDVTAIPMDELCNMIARGEVPDGKTQASVMKAAYILNNRK